MPREALAQTALPAHAILRRRVAELRRRGIVGEEAHDALFFLRQVLGAWIDLIEAAQQRSDARFLRILLILHRELDLHVAQPLVVEIAEVEHAVDALQVVGVVDDDLPLAVGREDTDPKVDLRFQPIGNREIRFTRGARLRCTERERGEYRDDHHRSTQYVHTAPPHRMRSLAELSAVSGTSQAPVWPRCLRAAV
jgi:hypothetical protein